MGNFVYYPYPNSNRKPDDPITSVFKWGVLGLGMAWLLKELFDNADGREEAIDADTVDTDGAREQRSAGEMENDSIGSPGIDAYCDLACEIERLSIQISALNRKIYRLKNEVRNSNGGADKDLLKNLAEIVFEHKVIRERLERVLNAVR